MLCMHKSLYERPSVQAPHSPLMGWSGVPKAPWSVPLQLRLEGPLSWALTMLAQLPPC